MSHVASKVSCQVSGLSSKASDVGSDGSELRSKASDVSSEGSRGFRIEIVNNIKVPRCS